MKQGKESQIGRMAQINEHGENHNVWLVSEALLLVPVFFLSPADYAPC